MACPFCASFYVNRLSVPSEAARATVAAVLDHAALCTTRNGEAAAALATAVAGGETDGARAGCVAHRACGAPAWRRHSRAQCRRRDHALGGRRGRVLWARPRACRGRRDARRVGDYVSVSAWCAARRRQQGGADERVGARASGRVARAPLSRGRKVRVGGLPLLRGGARALVVHAARRRRDVASEREADAEVVLTSW